MKKKVFKDRRGMTIAFPLFFLVLICCSAMVLDIGRAHMVQSKMQLIDDASALAGASTAEIDKGKSTFETTTDEKGNIAIVEVPGKPTLKIKDPQKAYDRAVSTVAANEGPGFWEAVMGVYQSRGTERQLDADETGWAGRVHGDNKYIAESRVKLAPGFLSFLGIKNQTVFTSGTGEAILIEEKNKEE